jgi:hypothetical protein
MDTTHPTKVIPKEAAIALCAEIRQQYLGKWWTFAGMQCWGCTTFSQGDPVKMCVSSRPDYRGCNLVTARYERRDRTT